MTLIELRNKLIEMDINDLEYKELRAELKRRVARQKREIEGTLEQIHEGGVFYEEHDEPR